MANSNQIQNKSLIYYLTDKIICFLWYLNLAKYFRRAAEYLTKANSNPLEVVNAKVLAIDVYIVLKWFYILVVTTIQQPSYIITFSKWYFIAANLQSFFYYFVWKETDTSGFTVHRQRRRLIHLFQAVLFSHLCFASLFFRDYANDLNWTNGKTFLKAFWLSVSNSVGGNYDIVKFVSDNAYSVMMVQFLITFLFAGIILSKAIPEYK